MYFPTMHDADGALELFGEAVANYERKYGISFQNISHFTEDGLKELHEIAGVPSVPPGFTVLSDDEPKILSSIQHLNEVANAPQLFDASRKSYLEALLHVYRAMPSLPEGRGSLLIGPEREGALLAKQLGAPDRFTNTWLPHAKRIKYQGGLLVGVSRLVETAFDGSALVIDGAIASGATLIGLMMALSPKIRKVEIRAVHATSEGLWAIERCARRMEVQVQGYVGHVVQGLDHRYYATDPSGPGRVAVGDLGDITCGS